MARLLPSFAVRVARVWRACVILRGRAWRALWWWALGAPFVSGKYGGRAWRALWWWVLGAPFVSGKYGGRAWRALWWWALGVSFSFWFEGWVLIGKRPLYLSAAFFL